MQSKNCAAEDLRFRLRSLPPAQFLEPEQEIQTADGTGRARLGKEICWEGLL